MTALLVVGLGVWVGVGRYADESCTGEIRLSIAAAPDIATVVRSAADGWATAARIGGRCVKVTVAAVAAADVAAAVAEVHGASVVGLGQANGSVVMPQVWVPDSSIWRLRLQAAAPGFRPVSMTPIASSPVVLAVPLPVASELGQPGAAITAGSLLQRLRSDSALNAGIADPTRDSAGLSGLLAFAQAAGSEADSEAATVAALRALARGGSAVRDDLLARFARSADSSVIAGSLSAAMLSEQSVISYNAASPPVPLVAVHLQPAPAPLDFPFMVMPGTDQTVVEAADGLRAALALPGFRDALARDGLRGADGVGGSGFALPAGAPSSSADPSPSSSVGPSAGPAQSTGGGADLGVLDRALGAWIVLTRPGRILAVVDVSESMLIKVPTAGNLTREQVTVEAAKRGLALFDDSWSVGLWTFSTKLDGDRDYRALLPIAPLSAARGQMVAELSGIRPKKGGATGLYDTILAAYREVQLDWNPGRLNTVVIMTGGENQDDAGLALPALLAELNKIKNPRRPVDIVAIGIGPDVGRQSLQQIVDATGGGVFIAPDPAEIGGIFLRALALHTRPK